MRLRVSVQILVGVGGFTLFRVTSDRVIRFCWVVRVRGKVEGRVGCTVQAELCVRSHHVAGSEQFECVVGLRVLLSRQS